MITIKKLRTLKTGTLRRKTAVLLQAFENNLVVEDEIDLAYLRELLFLMIEEFSETEVSSAAKEIGKTLDNQASGNLVYQLNSLRHAVLTVLGTEPADWDIQRYHSPVVGERGGEGRKVELYLDDIRSPFNLGSIFRTAEAFGVSRILLSPDCPSPQHRRAQRSSMGCTELVPWERAGKDEVFGKTDRADYGNIFALELGGTEISRFNFPREGIAVIGSEELGISPGARAAAENSMGLVSIPVIGLKGSINVSVAFGIMMQRWAES
ncbi:MAG: TrmH family RNA methyltransferase [Spirochaetales bacterium]|nr:TrmH family RNA methyltransferase [Spirochaetales bacterium]